MKNWKIAATLLLALMATPVMAIGTYAEGWMVVKKLNKVESQGIMFDSYEGELVVTSYEKGEKCSEDDYECFTPLDKTIAFSVRPENKEVVNFLQQHKDESFLIQYRIHRIESLGLNTDFEITNAIMPSPEAASPAPKLQVSKTGSRQFSFKGRFLKLAYQGTAVGTFEGLYLDEKTGKVHPFSVTNEQMAKHIYDVMKTGKSVYVGISDAIVTGFRQSDYDVYEVNEEEPAGME